MRPNTLIEAWKSGKKTINGWLGIPSSVSAEAMAQGGWDSITVDCQHGPIDFQAGVSCFQAIASYPVTPMARVPWLEPGIIMKMLDAGAYGIICPMINTKEQAEAFASYGRYAPRGQRSMGPNRAVQYGGADYAQHANDEICLFAMIETRQALGNLDQILAVPGIDGVYVGPSDLSVSMGKPPTLDPSDPEVVAAIDEIARKTRAKGLIAGVHTDGVKTAAKRFDKGYQLCTLLNDARMMAMSAQNMVRELKGMAPAAAAKTY